ncbi:ankyrin repeat-containing domain protein, partial [Schizothecium vesticola]
TPLHVAARFGRNVVIRLLLRYKADINARDLTGGTPLMIAVVSQQRGTTKLLIEKGANVNDSDSVGATPLHFAIYDSIEAIEYLLSTGADANAADTFGDTPLTALAVSLLLRKGADPSARCEHPQFPTPLWAAYAAKDRGIAELLLQHGADPDGEGEDRRTILHHGWERESEAWTELLLSGGEGLWKRADPRKEDGSGYEPIHWAVRSNRARVVEILKEGGACLDVRDRKEGLTPLIMALRPAVNTPMVMRLLNLGADWATKDEEGKDAFFHAV